jgi:hypothetical protein
MSKRNRNATPATVTISSPEMDSFDRAERAIAHVESQKNANVGPVTEPQPALTPDLAAAFAAVRAQYAAARAKDRAAGIVSAKLPVDRSAAAKRAWETMREPYRAMSTASQSASHDDKVTSHAGVIWPLYERGGIMANKEVWRFELSSPSGRMSKRARKAAEARLPQNAKLATEICPWCSALNEPHSPACPGGERYREVQNRGGVPMDKLSGGELMEWAGCKRYETSGICPRK